MARTDPSPCMAERVADFPWEATTLGPIADWPERLLGAAQVVLESPLPATLLCGPERLLIYNDAATAFYGAHHPDALGRSLAESWPEAYALAAHLYDRVFAGESVHVPAEPLDLERPGAGHVLDAYLTPVRDAGGVVIAAQMVGFVGAGVNAQAALRASEAKFRALAEVTPQIVWSGEGGSIDYFNRWWSEYTGLDEAEACAAGAWERVVHPDDRAAATARSEEAFRTGEPYDVEYRLRRADGAYRWHVARARRMPGTTRWVGAAADVDEFRRTEYRVRAGEARLRVALDAARFGAFTWWPLADEAELDERARALFGFARQERATLAALYPRIHPDDRAAYAAAIGEVLKATDDGRFNGQFRLGEGDDAVWRAVEGQLRVDAGGRKVMTGVVADITARKRDEERLRESEERQAFLLRLSDALAPVGDPVAIEATTTAMLGRHLGVARAYYAVWNGATRRWTINRDYAAAGTASVAGVYAWPDFSATDRPAFEDGVVVAADVVNHAHLSGSMRARIALYGIRAMIMVPVIKDGGLRSALIVAEPEPRAWKPDEVALVRDVAERTWAAVERARAEAALRDSEHRLHVLMEGVPQLVWRAVGGGRWTWAGPQWAEATGRAVPDSLGHGWTASVHPDDRGQVDEAWARAPEVGAYRVDHRLRDRRTGGWRWYQSAAAPVRDATGAIVEWLGTSTDVDTQRRLQESQAVLVEELQHRTRNLLAVVRSVSDRTLRSAADLSDFSGRFLDRVDALGRVQGLLSRLGEHDRVPWDELLRSELDAMGAGDRVRLHGPEGVRLRSGNVQMIALAVHELATNAAKYGALGQEGAQLAVSWRVERDVRRRPRLHVDWVESGVAMPAGAPPAGSGQGRELIERALPYQLGARTRFELGPDGVRCRMELPVSER